MTDEMIWSKHIWINGHRPARYLSPDPEFFNRFATEANYFGIAIKPTSARRQKELGVAKSQTSVIRLLVQRLLWDASYVADVQNVSLTEAEKLSQAAFLSNSFYGSKVRSS